MPISPAIPLTGLAGYNFLQRTQEQQTALFNSSPDIQRDVEYFQENIGNITSLDEFIDDRRILRFALGAFGLDDQINSGAIVRKVLAEGTTDRSAFAVRLNNSNFLDFARAFDFTNETFSASDDLISNTVAQYRERQFEIGLDDVDPNLRLASNFQREISNIANTALSERGGWFRVLGSQPLRAVIESAFNLPSSFSQLDLDRQVQILSDRALTEFGGRGVSVFSDQANIDKAIQRFFIREQIEAGPSASTPGATALTLLSSGGLGSAGLANLILSNA